MSNPLVYDTPAFITFLKEHPHEAAEVKFLGSIVKEGMKVIDVGANIGVTTIAIAKKIGERGSLYSFEPVPEYFDILRENLSCNGLKNVELFPLALTDQVGTVDFYQKELSSGIVPQEGVKKFKVNATTIDRFLDERKIERIDLINMDCEGAEFLVLKGAEKTLRRSKVDIFCEIHHDFLSQLGQSVGGIVEYLQRLEFEVHSVSEDLKIGNDFDKPWYIYAKK